MEPNHIYVIKFEIGKMDFPWNKKVAIEMIKFIEYEEYGSLEEDNYVKYFTGILLHSSYSPNDAGLLVRYSMDSIRVNSI